MFRPTYCPSGIWLRLHNFDKSPISEELHSFMELNTTLAADASAADAHTCGSTYEEAEQLTRSLSLYKPVQQEFTWRSSQTHTVRRTGFPLTHARYMTSTAVQGQTLRRGTINDCARVQTQGFQSLPEDQWWLHLYVVFSRVTCMRNMLLLRPPPSRASRTRADACLVGGPETVRSDNDEQRRGGHSASLGDGGALAFLLK